MLVADQSLAEALIVAHQDMHTRFPVTEERGNAQKIIGYVNLKDVVVALRLSPREPSLRNLVRPLCLFDPDASVADCLEYMMREHNHIALVRDVDGGIIGMVTMEDIVEQLVGQIHDEFDRMPAYLAPAGKGWVAGGFVSLSRLREAAGIELAELSERPATTLNDWIVERLGRPPRGGDEIEADSWRILVRKTRRALVQEAFFSPRDADATRS
jgi:putative hemolysin